MIQIIFNGGKGDHVGIERYKIEHILQKRNSLAVFYIPARTAVDIIEAIVSVSCIIQPILANLAGAEPIQFAYIVFHRFISRCVIFINLGV